MSLIGTIYRLHHALELELIKDLIAVRVRTKTTQSSIEYVFMRTDDRVVRHASDMIWVDGKKTNSRSSAKLSQESIDDLAVCIPNPNDSITLTVANTSTGTSISLGNATVEFNHPVQIGFFSDQGQFPDECSRVNYI